MNTNTSAIEALSSQLSASSSTASAVVIPLQHHEAFLALPDGERERVQLLMRLCAQVEASHLGTVAAIRLCAQGAGMSFSNLRTLFYAYRTTGDWRVFARHYSKSTSLPGDFLAEVKRRMECNARSMKQAMQAIKDDFRSGVEIPGYGTWRTWYAAEFPEHDLPTALPYGVWPRGWSQSNLYTKAPSKAERMLKARGWAAAKKFLPHVMRDMSGLRYLELIVIDDFETDVIVQARNPATGRYELVPCKGLLALDGATRDVLAWAMKPKFRKSDEEQAATGAKTHSITEADVKELLYSVFSGHGLPESYGVTILCENAAASISADFEMALETLFGVQVSRTGLMAKDLKTLGNGFVQGGGKPWEKGWIESTFNLVWNMAGALPGQKGASYQLKPADLEAKLLYAQKLLNTEGLTPEQCAELQTGFFTAEQLLTAFDRIFAALVRRTQHRMQGFDEVVDYRLPDGSATVIEAEAQKLPAETLVACELLPRRESPLERKAKLTRGVRFVKLAEAALAMLLLTAKRVTKRNHAIAFAHAGATFTFFDAASPVQALPEGTELLGYFDGADAAVLHCTSLDGRYLGALKRRKAVDIRDRAAIGAAVGAVSALIAQHVHQPVRERHAAENAQMGAALDTNRAKLIAWGVPEKNLPAPSAKAAPSREDNTARITETAGHSPTLVAPASLSAKLAAAAPDRAAQGEQRATLAEAIAADVHTRLDAAAESAAIQADDDLDPSALS